jgi:hypothetical protein
MQSARMVTAKRILVLSSLAGALLGLLAAGVWWARTGYEVPKPVDLDYKTEQLSERLLPVTLVPTKPVREARDSLEPEELVLGVTVGDGARAYPLNLLKETVQTEVLNDMLGGQAIAVTFCSYCHDGVVYLREVDGQRLTLGISGLLWQNNMVLYDWETGTQWSQLTGEAKAGQLKGKRLRSVPCCLTDWKSWRTNYPESTVASSPYTSRAFSKGFPRPKEDFVLGIAAAGQAKAWGFDQLMQSPVFPDEWDGRPVVVFFDPASGTARLYERTLEGRVLTFRQVGDTIEDEQTHSTWAPLTGKAGAGPLAGKQLTPLPGMVVLRNTWKTFYPRSQ